MTRLEDGAASGSRRCGRYGCWRRVLVFGMVTVALHVLLLDVWLPGEVHRAFSSLEADGLTEGCRGWQWAEQDLAAEGDGEEVAWRKAWNEIEASPPADDDWQIILAKGPDVDAPSLATVTVFPRQVKLFVEEWRERRIPALRDKVALEYMWACQHAGGGDVLAGAAAAGCMAGLCASAVLLTGPGAVTIGAGEQAIVHFPGFRRRLLLAASSSAALAAYFSTLATPWEGGRGPQALCALTCRRAGRAVVAAMRTVGEYPPPVRRRRKHGFIRL